MSLKADLIAMFILTMAQTDVWNGAPQFIEGLAVFPLTFYFLFHHHNFIIFGSISWNHFQKQPRSCFFGSKNTFSVKPDELQSANVSNSPVSINRFLKPVFLELL